MTFDPQPFDVLQGLLDWAEVFGIGIAIAVVVSLLVSLFVNKGRWLRAFGRQAARLGKESVHVSPRRTWAVAMLTFREAARRKALFVFIVFAVLFMFAGWFLSNANRRPEMQVTVYVSTMLLAISYMVIAVTLLLSCWGLPEDIKHRSLHTVVTKPVRRNEVYLGRIIGFSMIGTLVLAVMGGLGYVWIVREVPPEARSELVCRVPVYGRLGFLDNAGAPRERGINVGDIWEFRSFISGGTKSRAVWTFDHITPDALIPLHDPETGEVLIDEKTGEPQRALRLESRFEVFRTYKGDQKRGVRCVIYLVNDLRRQTAQGLAPISAFDTLEQNLNNSNFKAAAETLYGLVDGIKRERGGLKLGTRSLARIHDGYRDFAELMEPFLDDERRADDREWIRDVVQQAQRCSAAADAGDPSGLAEPLKALADEFEAHADVLQELLVDKVYRHEPFSVPEFKGSYPMEIRADGIAYRVNAQENLKQGNLFDHIVHGGKLRVEVNCLDTGQYLGMARPDLFIRLPDRQFGVGFAKALFGIWLMMLLVVILGVTASCFLKGPVATLLTLLIVILGSPFHDFLESVTSGKMSSAGAIESAVRLYKHLNPRSELGEGRAISAMRHFDSALIGGLKVVKMIVPNFDNYRVIPYVANGFDVPWNSALLPAILTTLGFLVPCLFLGYLSLASRELEDK